MNAWVTLVFGDRRYANGVAVLSESLKNAGSKYPLYCMVTDDIYNDEATVEFIRKFAVVVRVPYISMETSMKSKKQNDIYGKWINNSFTKWNILNPDILPFSKVCFIDADALVVSNCDDLFDLRTPAMCFSSPWIFPYTKSRARNPYIVRDEPAHGASISVDRVKTGLRSCVVGLGCMVVISPDAGLYNRLMEKSKNPTYGNANCISGPDEQLLAEVYIDHGTVQFTHIHQRYTAVVGKTNWCKEPAIVLQWYNSKPWLESPDAWPDLAIWYQIWDTIKAKYNVELVQK